MSIDFPAPATDGQLFSASNGVVYQYNAAYSSWLAQNPAPPIGGTGDFSSYGSPVGLVNLTPNTWQTVIITPTLGNSGLWYNVANGRYTPPAGTYVMGFTFPLILGSAVNVWARILKNGSVVLASSAGTIVSANVAVPLSSSITAVANGADFFEFQVRSDGTPSFTATQGTLPSIFSSPASGMQGPPGVISNGFRLISRVVPTAGQATVDFTSLPSDINDLRLHFDITPTTNDVDLFLRFYDSTGVVDATSGHYLWSNSVVGSTAALNGAPAASSSTSSSITTSIVINFFNTTARVANNAGNGGIKGQLSCTNIRDAARIKGVDWAATYLNGAGNAIMGMTGNGARYVFSPTGNITGLQLLFNGSTMQAGGAISLWGSP